MPYIPEKDRSRAKNFPKTEGELNFAITNMILNWLDEDISYSNLNRATGVLECVKLELYRRVAAPYEDKKCQENGDVYKTKEELDKECQ